MQRELIYLNPLIWKGVLSNGTMSEAQAGDGLEVGARLSRMDSQLEASANDRAAGQRAPGGGVTPLLLITEKCSLTVSQVFRATRESLKGAGRTRETPVPLPL